MTIDLNRSTNRKRRFLFCCVPHSVDRGPVSRIVEHPPSSNSLSVLVKACATAQTGSVTWLTCRNANGQGSVTVKVVIQ
ncbi:MAG TPA: hypothetical protein PLU35_10045 [Phycisphaerales bacterium]|nr:hypothetical protein [Phycisphaerales bacterium]